MSEASTSSLCLLHGVTGASDVPRVLEKAREAGLTTIEATCAGDIAGLVSIHGASLTESLSPEGMLANPERAADLALLHHNILAAAVAVTDVVPVRLGSVFSSLETARGLLSRERLRFAPELRRLKNSLEMGIRITAFEAQKAGSLEETTGRSYLRRRAAVRTDAAAERAEQTKSMRVALERLANFAVDAVKRPSRPREGEAALLADVAFLIRREELEAFQMEAEAMKQELLTSGVAIAVSGPWPAYSFISKDNERGASWATH